MQSLKKIGLILGMTALGFLSVQQSLWALSTEKKGRSASALTAPGSRPAAPNFKLTDLKGKASGQLSDLRGKAVLLDFWATWCPPCREEIPHFKELYAAYKARGFEIVGLSVGENPDTVAAFVAQNGITYRVGIATSAIEQAYGGIRGIPTTFLIDKQGRIAQKFVGFRPKEVFEQGILELLAES